MSQSSGVRRFRPAVALATLTAMLLALMAAASPALALEEGPATDVPDPDVELSVSDLKVAGVNVDDEVNAGKSPTLVAVENDEVSLTLNVTNLTDDELALDYALEGADCAVDELTLPAGETGTLDCAFDVTQSGEYIPTVQLNDEHITDAMFSIAAVRGDIDWGDAELVKGENVIGGDAQFTGIAADFPDAEDATINALVTDVRLGQPDGPAVTIGGDSPCVGTGTACEVALSDDDLDKDLDVGTAYITFDMAAQDAELDIDVFLPTPPESEHIVELSANDDPAETIVEPAELRTVTFATGLTLAEVADEVPDPKLKCGDAIQGTALDCDVSGLIPGDEINVAVTSNPTLLDDVFVANDDGVVSFSVDVPEDAEELLVVLDDAGGEQMLDVTLTVAAPEPVMPADATVTCAEATAGMVLECAVSNLDPGQEVDVQIGGETRTGLEADGGGNIIVEYDVPSNAAGDTVTFVLLDYDGAEFTSVAVIVGAVAPTCVDINTANQNDLTAIVHVGQLEAGFIIEERAQREFTNLDDLEAIPGLAEGNRIADIRAEGIAQLNCDGDQLPETGASTLLLTLFGLFGIGAGGGLLGVTRRR